MSDVDELYQEVLLDHFKHPRCHGTLCEPSGSAQLFNPLCGDKISVMIRLEHARIAEIAFTGSGCSISQAAASIMTELTQGKTIDAVREIVAMYRSLMRGEKTGEECASLGDAIALEGVRKFSARVKCAMLAWEALEKCLEQVKVPPVS